KAKTRTTREKIRTSITTAAACASCRAAAGLDAERSTNSHCGSGLRGVGKEARQLADRETRQPSSGQVASASALLQAHNRGVCEIPSSPRACLDRSTRRRSNRRRKGFVRRG